MLTRRAAIATTAAFAITPSAAFASQKLPPRQVICTHPAVRTRFMAVGRALHLSVAQVAAALRDDDVFVDTLCKLFKEHGISITWILTGIGEPVIAWWDDDDDDNWTSSTDALGRPLMRFRGLGGAGQRTARLNSPASSYFGSPRSAGAEAGATW